LEALVTALPAEIVDGPSAYERLRPKHKVFVDNYLLTFNASEAAREAGYRHPRQEGHYLLTRHDGVKAAVREQLEANAATREEAVARVSLIARTSIDDFLNEDGRLDLAKARASGKLGAVRKMKFDPESGHCTELELYSALEANTTILKVTGALNDRQEADRVIELRLSPMTLEHWDKL
jgi:hypothetical protein